MKKLIASLTALLAITLSTAAQDTSAPVEQPDTTSGVKVIVTNKILSQYSTVDHAAIRGIGVSTIPIRIEDIVVTATRTPRWLSDSPVITRVVRGSDIAATGAPSLEKVLERELAGVEFHQAGYGTTVSFQGLDARYVLFLVDGERIAGETYGNIDFSRIPVSNIERIEIVRGASSVLYGSNAMGAVVNIITKMPKERLEIAGSFRYGTKFQDNHDEVLGVNATDKQVNKYRDKLDLPNTVSDLSIGLNLGKFRSLTSASYRTTDAYKVRGRGNESRHYDTLTMKRPVIQMGPGGPSPVFENGIMKFIDYKTVLDTTISAEPDQRGLGVSGSSSLNISQKFDYTLNRKFRFELSGTYFDRERYDFYTSLLDDNPMSGYLPGTKAWTNEKYHGYSAKALMEHSPSHNHKVYLSFVRDEYRRDLDSLGSTRHKQRHTYNIPRLLWTWDVHDQHKLTTGAEFTNEQLRFDLNPLGFDNTKEVNTASLYVQDEIRSRERLSFVAGVRGDWSDRFGWRATPQFSVRYRFWSRFTLRGNFSMGYRTPSLKEMYMDMNIPVAGAPRIVGNSDLKAETSTYYSASLAYDSRRFIASATFGYSHFRDKIDARWETVGSERLMRYNNIDRSELGNVELMARVYVLGNRYNINRIYVTANYNHIFQSDNAPESSTQYIYTSPHTLTASIDYEFGHGQKRYSPRMRLNVNAQYISSKRYEDFMPYINLTPEVVAYIADRMAGVNSTMPGTMMQSKYYTGSYSARHKGYAVCNASASVEFRQISLTVGVDNIFDYRPKVVNFNSAITPRTNGFVKLGFKINPPTVMPKMSIRH